MSQRGKCQNLTIQTKAEILQKHLYQKIKVNDLAAEYDTPANIMSTWKKTCWKIFKRGRPNIKKKEVKYNIPFQRCQASFVILAKRDEI